MKRHSCGFGDGPDMTTGFGNEVRQFISYLNDYKHMVVDIYQMKMIIDQEKYRSFSRTRLKEENYNALKGYDVDAVITLGGLWMRPEALKIKQLCDCKWISLYRVDSLPLNSFDIQMIKTEIDKTVVPSKWLEAEFKKQMLPHERIPEGISLDLFKRLDDVKRRELREGFEDKLIYGCTNRNMFPRKFYDILLRAFAKFSSNKNDVKLLLHCDPYDKEGLPLDYLVKALGLRDKVIFSPVRWDRGAGLEHLVEVYNQIDVWVSTSGGESFGRGNIEALASGCNIIAPEHTSFDELVKGHGIGVPAVGSFFYPKVGQYIYVPSLTETVAAMERYYKDPELREAHKFAGRDFIKSYDIKAIMPKWKDKLTQWLQ